MKVLVTGGAGLIGSHIVDLLLERGHEVRILDNLEPETHLWKPNWIPNEVEFLEGSVTNIGDVEKALKGVEIIFHQAAYGGFAPGIKKYIVTNSLGTANIFDVIKEKALPVKKIIVASSQAVYGEGKYKCIEHGITYPKMRLLNQLMRCEWEVKCPKCGEDLLPLPTDEDSSIDPGFIYSITKFSEEQIAIKVGKSLNIPTVALRYSLTYGPRQSITNPYTGICSIFSSRIINDLPILVYEDGKQTRDFIYVGDVAEANLFVMETEKADYGIFNVGTGHGTSVLKFIEILSKPYGKAAKIKIENQFRAGEVRHLFCDNSNLAKIGFKPRINLKEGIKNYAEWFREQTNVKDFFSEAYEKMKKRGIVLQANPSQ